MMRRPTFEEWYESLPSDDANLLDHKYGGLEAAYLAKMMEIPWERKMEYTEDSVEDWEDFEDEPFLDKADAPLRGYTYRVTYKASQTVVARNKHGEITHDKVEAVTKTFRDAYVVNSGGLLEVSLSGVGLAFAIPSTTVLLVERLDKNDKPIV